MPCALPPKYCACMPHGVKLMRMITLSAAWAAGTAASASAPARASTKRRVRDFPVSVMGGPRYSWKKRSDGGGGIVEVGAPGNAPLGPRHEIEEGHADDSQGDDRRERPRGIEIEAA